MGINPLPVLLIGGRRIARSVQEAGRNWTSVALDGLELNLGGRTVPTEPSAWPTAAASILCDEVPDYLITYPAGQTVLIRLQYLNVDDIVFRGYVDTVKVTAVRTRVEGHEYMFRVDLSFISRPAAIAGTLFSSNAANNRPEERFSTRMAWLETALHGNNHAYIDRDYWQNTPLFSGGKIGSVNSWNYNVAAKDYRGASVIDAATEMLTTAGEMYEYYPRTDRLSLLGRVSVPGNITRLGWSHGVVTLTKDSSRGYYVPGRVFAASRVAMADTSYTDVGRVNLVRVPITYNNSPIVGAAWTDATDAPSPVDISTLAVFDANGSRYDAVQATARKFRDLFNDARLPIHPQLTIKYPDGFPSESAASGIFWGGIYAYGIITVAGSVFNRLRKDGLPYHARGTLKLTWAAVNGQPNQRRWTAVMGLTPIKNDLTADLLVKDINPSATAVPASTLTYATIPGTPTLEEHATDTVGHLAAALARTTSTAFKYDDFNPRLTVAEMASAGKGL